MFNRVIVIIVDFANEDGTHDVKLNDICDNNDIVHAEIMLLADLNDDNEADALFTNEVAGKVTVR